MPDAEPDCDSDNGQVDTENNPHKVYSGTKQLHKWIGHIFYPDIREELSLPASPKKKMVARWERIRVSRKLILYIP